MTRLSEYEAVLRVRQAYPFETRERKTMPTSYHSGLQFTDFTSSVLRSEVPGMPGTGDVIRAKFQAPAGDIEVAITRSGATVFNRPVMTGYKATRLVPADLPPEIVYRTAAAEGWESWLLDEYKARLIEGHL